MLKNTESLKLSISMGHSLFKVRELQAAAKYRPDRGTNNLLDSKIIYLITIVVKTENHFSNRLFARVQKNSLLYDRLAVVL